MGKGRLWNVVLSRGQEFELGVTFSMGSEEDSGERTQGLYQGE